MSRPVGVQFQDPLPAAFFKPLLILCKIVLSREFDSLEAAQFHYP